MGVITQQIGAGSYLNSGQVKRIHCGQTHSDNTMRRFLKILLYQANPYRLSRTEFFNPPNTTKFNAPSSTIDGFTCRTVTATSIPPRDIQFALKYNF